MKAPKNGSHWNLRGTVVVVANVSQAEPPGIVYAVTEDGYHRTYELPWFVATAVEPTAEELGLVPDIKSEWLTERGTRDAS